MEFALGELWNKSRNRLKAGWLIIAGVIAICAGTVGPMDRFREEESQRETGLGAVAFEPASMWHQTHLSAMLQTGVIGGMPGRSVDMAKVAAPMGYNNSLPIPEERKVIRTAMLDGLAKNPRVVSDQIRQITQRAGGFIDKSETYGQEALSSASLVVRVPADRFEDVRSKIHELGIRVQSENLQAQDVTKQYVDQAARLRNLQAQESQYLGILKSAKTVKDTLEVSEKLEEVRGEIEQQQAELRGLSKEVETVLITISLHAEADAQVFGMHWRPLYELKLSARHGLQSIADYVATMASFLFYLPSILLWLATILIGAAVGWRLLRWAARALFPARTTVRTA
jgi:Domain of unknown function (DUF4349)